MYYVHDKATKNCATGINQKQCSINIVDMVFTISLKGVLRQGKMLFHAITLENLFRSKLLSFTKLHHIGSKHNKSIQPFLIFCKGISSL